MTVVAIAVQCTKRTAGWDRPPDGVDDPEAVNGS